jgi:hypothetical protein
MHIKILEITSAICAFIPFVSIVTAPISAYVYYNRTKNGETPEREKVTKTADAINGLEKFYQLKNEERGHDQTLWKVSLWGALPGVNLITAIYTCVLLAKLSKTREAIQQNFLDQFRMTEGYPETQLIQKLGPFPDEESNVFMLKMINLIIKSNACPLIKGAREYFYLYCYHVIKRLGTKNLDAKHLLTASESRYRNIEKRISHGSRCSPEDGAEDSEAYVPWILQ